MEEQKPPMIEDFFTLKIESEGQTASIEPTLSDRFANIRQILVTSNRKDLAVFRGSVKLNIGDIEVLPKGYRAELLIPSVQHAPDEKFRTLLDVAGTEVSREIFFEYTDDANGIGTFAPHEVYLYVRGDRKDKIRSVVD